MSSSLTSKNLHYRIFSRPFMSRERRGGTIQLSRFKMLHFILFFCLPAFIIGCASAFNQPTTRLPIVTTSELNEEITVQTRDNFNEWIKNNRRVQKIADRILLTSADLCGKTKMDYGFYWIDAATLSQISLVNRLLIRDHYRDHYQLQGIFNDGNLFPFVSAIRQSSGAEDGELKIGDRITRFNGEFVEPEYTGESGRKFGYVYKAQWNGKLSLAIKKSLEEQQPITVEVIRTISTERKRAEDTIVELSISPKKVCDYRVSIINSSGKNAYTDGKSIGITTGFLPLLDDKELALIIGHELAHITEKHIEKKRENRFTGAFLGTFFDALAEAASGTRTYGRYKKAGEQIGQEAFSQGFEAEADYVGLYMLARAGYETESAATFWRKMAEGMPAKNNSLTGTHPLTAYRYLMLAKAHTEIEGKKAKGEILLPNRLEKAAKKSHKSRSGPGRRSYSTYSPGEDEFEK